MKKMKNNGRIMMLVMKMMMNQIQKIKQCKKNLNPKNKNKLSNNKYKKNKKKKKVMMMMTMTTMILVMILNQINFYNKIKNNKKYTQMGHVVMIHYKGKKKIFIFTLIMINNKNLTEII